MKAVAWLALATLATGSLSGTSVAADKKNSEMIVGKWTPDGPKGKGVVLEFTKDGKMKISIGPEGMSFVISGTYKALDDNTIEMSMENPQKKEETKSQKLTIKAISADEATIVGPDGKEEKLKAVK